jgi:hypothetical protein
MPVKLLFKSVRLLADKRPVNILAGPLLYESRLVTEPLTYADDERVVEWGIGLTNIVQRPSPSSQDLHRY